ncbi:MAG TPA: bacterial transcriptional activator domain-containing protein, partial [Clostridia bacterium]|nr:bacterial transcriptional activator domain-containing protein [Clostridia bacterium]
NPKNVLRTQISRLRNMVEVDRLGIEPFFTIESLNGYYIMKFNDNCNIDFVDFERLIYKGEVGIRTNFEEGTAELRKAIDLYGGQYLLELEEEGWTMPSRNRYDRLFSKGILMYLEALSQKGMHQEVIELAERAVQIRPYEEMIHVFFIESLIKANQKLYASNHYQYYTSKVYNDLGLKPSQQMRDLYKRLVSHEEIAATGIVNLSMLGKVLEDTSTDKGVLICDKSYYKFLYSLEKRNRDREDKNIFVGLISIDNRGHITLSQDEVRSGIDILLEVAYKNLRKGDVMTQWNDSQVTMLAYNVLEENVHIIDDRLTREFHEAIGNPRITISIKFRPL